MDQPKIYRAKASAEIEAMQWTGENTDVVRRWTGLRDDGMPIFYQHAPATRGTEANLWSEASESWCVVKEGDWVARDALGFYPIDAQMFMQRWTDNDDTSVSFHMKMQDGDEATVTVDGFTHAATAARALIHCGSPDVVLKLITQYAEQGDTSVVALANELGSLAEKKTGLHK